MLGNHSEMETRKFPLGGVSLAHFCSWLSNVLFVGCSLRPATSISGVSWDHFLNKRPARHHGHSLLSDPNMIQCRHARIFPQCFFSSSFPQVGRAFSTPLNSALPGLLLIHFNTSPSSQRASSVSPRGLCLARAGCL